MVSLFHKSQEKRDARAREYDDDDGFVVADMSNVTPPSLLDGWTIKRPPGREGNRSGKEKAKEVVTRESEQDYEYTQESEQDYGYTQEPLMTKSEGRWFFLGAMKAVALIGLAYIVGIGLLIGLLILLWNMLS